MRIARQTGRGEQAEVLGSATFHSARLTETSMTWVASGSPAKSMSRPARTCPQHAQLLCIYCVGMHEGMLKHYT